MKEKPQFVNTPPEQNEKAKEEIQKAEASEKRATEKKERKQKEYTKAHPYAWITTLKEWVFWILVFYTLISLAIPFFRSIKYNTINRNEMQFTQENPALVKSMREYREARIKEVDEKITSAFGQ